MHTRQARQRAFLASRGFELSPVVFLADTVVAPATELDLGNQRLRLLDLGKAESDDALAIHMPQEACVVAGDTIMTGSFPIFGQPVMNEGLMGTTAWLETLANLERLQATHVLPGHGPRARQADLALFKRLQQYFLDEVAVRVARQMPLPALLAEIESQLPEWIAAIPVVWGTPRYAILRVFRGLVDDPQGEPGWQHYKPSAIPAENAPAVARQCADVSEITLLQDIAREFAEGGDVGSAIAVARRAAALSPESPAVWCWLADCLVRGAEGVPSVLEKGDFFSAAWQALQQALALDPQHAAAHLACGRLLIMAAYRNGGDPTPGLAYLQHVIESIAIPAPSPAAALLAQAYFYRGLGHRTQGKESQALSCFRTALIHLPTFQPALLALG
jgi:tetratricopeptide (TPR) repeat protein